MDHASSIPTPVAVRARVIPTGSDWMKRVIVAGLLVALVLVALQAIGQIIDFSVYNLRIRALNSDKHDSLFGIASLLAQMSLAAASVWRGRQVDGRRWAWFALGAIVGVLVVVRAVTTFNATLLTAPLAIVFSLLCWLTWRDRAVARSVVWAGLVLMMTSLLLHKVGIAADASTASDYTWAYQIVSMIKHGAELSGWILLTVGVLAGLERRATRDVTPGAASLRELESVAR